MIAQKKVISCFLLSSFFQFPTVTVQVSYEKVIKVEGHKTHLALLT